MSFLKSILSFLKKSKIILVGAVIIAGFALAVLMKSFNGLEIFENKILDKRFQYASHPELADTNIVMIAIDQNSLDYFEQELKFGFPWPRQFHGLVVDYLAKAGAKTISFDIIFSSPDVNRLEIDGAESDGAFASAVQNAGNVMLGVQLMPIEEGDAAGGRIHSNFFATGEFPRLKIPSYQRATAPLDTFQSVASRLGVFNFKADDDGICRRTPLLYRWGPYIIPHFSLSTLSIGKNISLKVANANTDLQSMCQYLPVDDKGEFMIYWYGKGGPNGVFKYYPFAGVLQSAVQMASGETPAIDMSVFKDKYVIVGASAAGLSDFKPTPFTNLEEYPGMEIHATILSNLRNEHYIRESPKHWNYLIALALSIIVAVLFFTIKRVTISIPLISLSVSIYVAIAFWQFYESRLWLPVAFPFISALFTLILSAVASYATEGQQKQELRKAFNRYLNPQVIDQIIQNPDKLELGGTEIEATVFFSDIAGFTSIAEKLPPKELILFLNEYLTVGSEIILARDAMIDKYIGDAIMAIFGAPIPKPGHASNACLTSLEIQRRMADYYSKKSTEMPHFETRIGLNTGRLVLGNVGSSNRLDFTAIGDTVNLASRLEGANKQYGTNILISESTYNQAKEAVEVRELDLLRVKGKEIPIRLFEVVTEKGNLIGNEKEKIDTFHEGLRLYRSQLFDLAIIRFNEVLKINPKDGPANTYLERCESLRGQTMPEDWDGVYIMKTK
ncbi:MAG: adenylate/guanylate cyclase domain-containing protein [Chloroherpetonaceae bacterium]|nr:adenylate/guanylate cyclase domain-containing protein [Chloroherpetonaceae bacterium]